MNVVEKRKALGNGHRTWMKLLSPPLSYVRRFGELWEGFQKNKGANSESVIKDLGEAYLEFERVVAMQTNAQVVEDVHTYFQNSVEEPLHLVDRSVWFWLSRYVMAVRTARAFLQQEALSGKQLESDSAAGAINGICWYAHYNAWALGDQTFVFSLPLASKLLLTDSTHIKWRDFHCPFPAFVIQVPPSLALLVDPSTGEHSLDTIMVVDGRSEGKRRVQILFKGRENEKSKCLGDDTTIYSHLLCRSDDDDLEKSISRSISKDSEVFTEFEQARVVGKTGDEAVRQLMRFAVACIVYLTDFSEDRVVHVDPEIDKLKSRIPLLKGKGKKNAKAKLRSLLREPASQLVGTKVTIDPTLEKIAGAIGRGEALPPSVASYVRGHRKMQPHGPARSLRKPIWVDPYWRNLEQERSTSKTYDVK